MKSTTTDVIEEVITSQEDDLEEYEVAVTDALTLQLLQSNLSRAQVELQLTTERFENFKNSLAGKYSEHGAYELVGELNLAEMKGTRRKVS